MEYLDVSDQAMYHYGPVDELYRDFIEARDILRKLFGSCPEYQDFEQ